MTQQHDRDKCDGHEHRTEDHANDIPECTSPRITMPRRTTSVTCKNVPSTDIMATDKAMGA